MKLRTQRLFIALLSFLLVGVASVNAYTFNVTNWNPFGVLNLEKLILKGSLNETGIILDGGNRVIKIDPFNEDTNGGQLRVYQICDENGQNCNEVSKLTNRNEIKTGKVILRQSGQNVGEFEIYTDHEGIQQINLLQGPAGPAGANGANGASINTVFFSGNDLIFGRDDGTPLVILNAKNTLKGAAGAAGATGPAGASGPAGIAGASINTGYFQGNDLVFKRDDGAEIRLVNAKEILRGPQGPSGTGGGGGGISISNNNYVDSNFICYRTNTSELTCLRLKISTDANAYQTDGRLCYVQNQTLICNQENLFETLSERISNLSGNLVNLSGDINNYITNVYNELSGDMPIVYGNTNGYLCSYSGGNLDCTRAIKLGTMDGGKMCIYDNGTINCTENKVEISGDNSILIGGSVGKICVKESETSLNCSDSALSSMVVIQNTGTNTKYCYSTDGKNLYCDQSIPDNTVFVALQGTQTINGTKTFTTSPVVPSKTTAATNNGTKIATEAQVYAVDQKVGTLSGNILKITTAGNNSGQYCYSTDGKNLTCNKSVVQQIIDQIFEGDTNNFFKKIVINNFTGTLMTGNNGQICYKNGDMIECKINSGVFLTGGSLAGYITGGQISQFITGGRLVGFLTSEDIANFLTQEQFDELIREALDGIGQPNNAEITIYQGNTPKGSFTLNQPISTGIYLDFGGGGIDASGTPGKRCKYQCQNTEVTINWRCTTQACYDTRNKFENRGCTNPTTDSDCISIVEEYYRNQRVGSELELIYSSNGNCSIICEDDTPSCEGQCSEAGNNDGITVSGETLGGYCRYVTQDLLNYIQNPFFGSESDMPTSTEGGWIQCSFTGGTSNTTTPTPSQTITINGTTNNICVKVNDTTINCNIPLEDIQGSGGGDGSDLWLGNNSLVYPQKTTTKVAIGTTASNNYTLNVNGSGWIQNNLKLGTYLYFEGRPISRNVFNFKQSAVAQKSSPVIEYYNDLLIRPLNIVTDYRTNNYITLGKSGNVGIGGEYSDGDIKLSVYGKERVYSVRSGVRGYVDIYNDNSQTYIISNWSNIILGLTGNSDVVGVTLPNAYINIAKNTIGIKKDPTPSTWNSSTQAGYYSPTLQIGGSIQIESEYRPSNRATQQNQRFKCNANTEGTLAYRSGYFYGCVKGQNNVYHRRYFTTQTFESDGIPAMLPTAPAQQ